MCNNCNCDFYQNCSIVGYMPVGFCCERCFIHDPSLACLNAMTTHKKTVNSFEKDKSEDIHPIRMSIEGGLLKVVLLKGDNEIPIVIDLQKQLGSK